MKKYLKYLLIFIFCLIIFCLSPISGDDWGNFLVGREGIRRSLGVALGMYFDWEGRIVSRVFINILTYHKWLWNIVNAFLISLFVFIVEKFMTKKKRFIFPLIILIIFGMNPYTFSEVITWLAGNMTYFFIVPVILFYFYYLINNDKYNKWFVFIFSLINLFGTMFVENMALVLVIGNILLIIYKYIKHKKIDKRLILYLILSVSSTLVMLLSPGTRYRNSIENIQFNKLGFFEKIVYNIPNFIYYTFCINSYMLILMSLSNYLLIKENIKNKKLKYFLIIFMLVVPLLTIGGYIFNNTKLAFLIDSKNIILIIYWLLYLGCSFVLIYIDERKDVKLSVLFLIGLVSNVVMLISPTWGFRTSFFTYVVFSVVSLIVIDKYLKDNKYGKFGCYCLLIFSCLFYLVFYINIYRCQINLEKSIERQLSENKDIIYIEKFPSFANCNINPGDSFHISKFKLYYDIPDDKEIILVDGDWKYLILYK